MALDLKIGEQVGLPPATHKSLILDADGAPFLLTSDGTREEIGGGGSGTVESVVAGDGITIDDADPANPVVTADLVSIVAGDGIDVDDTDPANPVISSTATCAVDPWLDMVAAFAASKVPTLVNVVFRSKCTRLSEITAPYSEVERDALSGTGATAIIDPTKNGGVIKLSTGTTGNSFRIVRNANGNSAAGLKAEFVSNLRTQKWAVFGRIARSAVGAGSQIYPLMMTPEAANDCRLAIVGGTSTANWTLMVGTSTADTGTALPAIGTFVTVCIIGDGTNVSAWNVETGVQIGANTDQSTCVTSASHVIAYATDSGTTSRDCYIDDWACITEPAA